MTTHASASGGSGLLRTAVGSLLLLPLALAGTPATATYAQQTDTPEADTQASTGTEREARPLRPGDVVEVTSWSEPDLSGEYVVDEDGRVVLPVLGSRSVAGEPPNRLREQLLEEYRSQFRQDSFQVIFKRRIRVLGEVREPGLYHVDPSMTLGDAIALAGGVGEEGTRRIRIVREGETVQEVQLSPDRPITADVRSGDQIMVLRRSWLSRHSPIFVGAVASGLAFYFTRR